LGDNELIPIVMLLGGGLLAWKLGLFDKLGDAIKPGTDTNTDTNTDTTPTGAGIKFAAAGDWGSGRNKNWEKVVAAMKKFDPDVVLVPGDMSYTDEKGFEPVTTAIKAFPAKVFGAQGNHDGSSYSSLFDAYSNSVTTVGNVSFMSLNSNSTGSAISYAKANMSKMTARWKVVFFHHPVYTVKSDHGGDMKGIQPDLAAGKIDLCIAAHNHNYQRFAPIGGVTHIVSGLGGEGPYGVGAYSGTPANVKKYNSTNGFSAFTTGDSNIQGQFIDVADKVIDTFSITKAAAAYARAYNTSARASYGILRPRIVA
jgi:predicted phosphodiesterase